MRFSVASSSFPRFRASFNVILVFFTWQIFHVFMLKLYLCSRKRKINKQKNSAVHSRKVKTPLQTLPSESRMLHAICSNNNGFTQLIGMTHHGRQSQINVQQKREKKKKKKRNRES